MTALKLSCGVGLRYNEVGSGQPLVLVHGSPGEARAWARVVGHLAPALRVRTPDLPGYGGSDPLICQALLVSTVLDRATARNADDVRAAFAETVTAAQLGSFDRPVLIVHGTASNPVARRIALSLAGLMPRGQVESLAGATHAMLDTIRARWRRLLIASAAAKRSHPSRRGRLARGRALPPWASAFVRTRVSGSTRVCADFTFRRLRFYSALPDAERHRDGRAPSAARQAKQSALMDAFVRGRARDQRSCFLGAPATRIGRFFNRIGQAARAAGIFTDFCNHDSGKALYFWIERGSTVIASEAICRCSMNEIWNGIASLSPAS